LREIENHAGIGVEFFLEVGDELFFCVDGGLRPGFVVAGFQAYVKLAIEETRGVGAV
jgi:hypothetical protein